MPIHRKVNHAFFSGWNQEMAYVLGFFAADGTMIENNRGAHYLEFHITDKELLESIRHLMRSNHKIAVRVRDPRWRLGYRIQIGSKQICANLQVLGFTSNKSKDMKLPKIPPKFVGSFVRGYFDGDGCVYYSVLKVADRKNPKKILQTKFTCGCRAYLESFLSMLRDYGISGGYIITKTRGAFELALSHRDSLAIYKLMYNNAPTCGVYLERKKSKFDHAIQEMYAGVA